MPTKPIRTVGFYHDGQFGGSESWVAVRAAVQKVSPVLADVFGYVRVPDARPKDFEKGLLAWQAKGSDSTSFAVGSYLGEGEAERISAKLGTVVAMYCYEKTSGWTGIDVFDCGKLIERYSFGVDYSDEMSEFAAEAADGGVPAAPKTQGMTFSISTTIDGMQYRFESARRELSESELKNTNQVLDGIARFYGVLIPAQADAPGKRTTAKKLAERFAGIELLRRRTAEDAGPADAALAAALKAGDLAKLDEALAAGASVKGPVAAMQRTPIEYVIRRGDLGAQVQVEMIARLAKAGADVHASHLPKENTPWIQALRPIESADSSLIPVLDLLLSLGADIDSRGLGLIHGGKAAMHVAAVGGCLAAVKFLHARGASVDLPDGSGKSPRRNAEETLGRLTEEAEFVGVERWRERLRAVIEYLKRAESGAPPENDWPDLMARDAVEVLRERRERSVKFAEFEKQMNELGAAMRVAMEAEQNGLAAKSAERAAVAKQPDRIAVSRDDSANWANPSRRDQYAAALEEAGFTRVGTYTVDRMHGVRMLLLIDSRRQVYAVACEQTAHSTWVDLVRFHADGSVLTVTNADTTVSIDVPGQVKLRDRRWGVNQLLARLDASPAPASVEAATVEAFVPRIEAYVAKQLAALRGA